MKKILLLTLLFVNMLSYSQTVTFIELICFDTEEVLGDDDVYFKIDGHEENILFKNINEKDIIDLNSNYKKIHFLKSYIVVQIWEDDPIESDLLGEVIIKSSEKGFNRKIFKNKGPYYVLTYIIY